MEIENSRTEDGNTGKSVRWSMKLTNVLPDLRHTGKKQVHRRPRRVAPESADTGGWQEAVSSNCPTVNVSSQMTQVP